MRPPGGAKFIAYEPLEEVDGVSVESHGGLLVVFCEVVRLAAVDESSALGAQSFRRRNSRVRPNAVAARCAQAASSGVHSPRRRAIFCSLAGIFGFTRTDDDTNRVVVVGVRCESTRARGGSVAALLLNRRVVTALALWRGAGLPASRGRDLPPRPKRRRICEAVCLKRLGASLRRGAFVIAASSMRRDPAALSLRGSGVRPCR